MIAMGAGGSAGGRGEQKIAFQIAEQGEGACRRPMRGGGLQSICRTGTEAAGERSLDHLRCGAGQGRVST